MTSKQRWTRPSTGLQNDFKIIQKGSKRLKRIQTASLAASVTMHLGCKTKERSTTKLQIRNLQTGSHKVHQAFVAQVPYKLEKKYLQAPERLYLSGQILDDHLKPHLEVSFSSTCGNTVLSQYNCLIATCAEAEPRLHEASWPL